MQEVKLIVRNKKIRDVELPERTRVTVYDYDLSGRKPEDVHRDQSGKPCWIKVYERYEYNRKTFARINKIDHDVVVHFRNAKVSDIKHPKTVKVTIHDVTT